MTTRAGPLLGLCRADPNAFIEFVGGYRQGSMHIQTQEFLTVHSSCYIEDPRNHGKTEQLIYRLAWEIGHNRDLMVKVVKCNDDEAVDFTSAVKSVLESPLYRLVFPEVEPDPEEWGKESFRVVRTVRSKDPTMKASGIFGNPGGRADILVFDDICTLKNSVQNPAQREQVKQAYAETWLPMLKKGGRVWRICTPWHVDDVTAEWRSNPRIKTLRRPCIGTEWSPWYEWWTPEELAAKREEMGEIAYARAYLLKPLSGEEIVFPEELLQKFFYCLDSLPESGRTVIAVDMAFTERDRPAKTRKKDPDYSVILIGRLTPQGHCYPFRCWRGRVDYPTFRGQLARMVREHRVDYVVSEDVGPLRGINQDLAASLTCSVKTVSRNKDKYARAVERQPFVEQGRFHLPTYADGRLVEEFVPVLKELTEFPVGSFDDTVDACVDLMGEAAGDGEEDAGIEHYDIYSVRHHLRADPEWEEELAALYERIREDQSDDYFGGRVFAGSW